MRSVTNTNLLFWVNLPMEHFLRENVPLRHVILNVKTLFMSWWRSAFNEVNDWALYVHCTYFLILYRWKDVENETRTIDIANKTEVRKFATGMFVATRTYLNNLTGLLDYQLKLIKYTDLIFKKFYSLKVPSLGRDSFDILRNDSDYTIIFWWHCQEPKYLSKP